MAQRYNLVYSQTAGRQIRKLHPHLKSLIRSKIEKIRENPYIGKSLERELSGYLSFRTKRYRIIYRVLEGEKVIQIHHVGHRRDIYELLAEQIRKD